MHGRLKVKTTAEQEEAKRKEREKKLKLYRAGTSLVFQKIANNEYDSEGLATTADLLSANPDFYTLWNYRRNAFLHMKENISEEELQTKMLNELSFLEQCLKTNPKSYGTWHHRGWILQNMPQPDWKNEIRLCNKFLEYDERNFHCWDYRRLAVKEAKVTPEDELKFTTNKIETNFSNYSSWHYRTKLLPLVYGDDSQPTGMKEDQLISECIMVQNAFFTDPNDQSAWFYHRWLLGRVTRPLRIESVVACRCQDMVIVGLSKAVDLKRTDDLHLYVGGAQLPHKWYSPSGDYCSSVWIYHEPNVFKSTDSSLAVTVQLTGSDSAQTIHLSEGQNRACWQQDYPPGTKFRHEISAVTNDVLTQELSSLQQLHDLEPDNKWVLLTIVSLMRALDPIHHQDETFDYISKLMQVDPMRTNYYLDLKTKFIIENALESLSKNTTLEIVNKGLTTLVHTDCMVTMETINLSQNALQRLPDLSYLQCVKVMKLDGNKIDSCEAFRGLPSLEELSLCDNNISSTDDLLALRSCPKLTRLHLQGNPVCGKKSDIVDFLMSLHINSNC